jgi:hypothetical protein
MNGAPNLAEYLVGKYCRGSSAVERAARHGTTSVLTVATNKPLIRNEVSKDMAAHYVDCNSIRQVSGLDSHELYKLLRDKKSVEVKVPGGDRRLMYVSFIQIYSRS